MFSELVFTDILHIVKRCFGGTEIKYNQSIIKSSRI